MYNELCQTATITRAFSSKQHHCTKAFTELLVSLTVVDDTFCVNKANLVSTWERGWNQLTFISITFYFTKTLPTNSFLEPKS